jgi:hypothetical protein
MRNHKPANQPDTPQIGGMFERSSLFYGRNSRVFANFLCQLVNDFIVTRDGGCFIRSRIPIHAMTTALTQQFTAVLFEIPDEFLSLYWLNHQRFANDFVSCNFLEHKFPIRFDDQLNRPAQFFTRLFERFALRVCTWQFFHIPDPPFADLFKNSR